MTVAVIALAIICGLLVLALVYREAQHSKHVAEREKTWDLERGALLTRIQHPEIVIPAGGVTETAGGMEIPDEVEEQDDIDLVGTVVDGVENG